ncbi:MAG: response regulator [Alicyclobacillus sp.]|nr:response regulator [Alicyclobacillus sp.]
MIRVVLVDDEENALNVLEIFLQQVGDVLVAARYTNALEALAEMGSIRPDAVFLDMHMPGIHGLEAAERVNDVSPGTHIVFTTAYAEHAVDAFTLGSLDYLLKPVTLERLRKAVERIQASARTTATVPTPVSADLVCMGGFFIQWKTTGERLSWRTSKQKELCAFLVHHGGDPVDQAVIMEAMWPDSDTDKARAYLYTCVSLLRKQFRESGLPLDVRKVGTGYALALNGIGCDWMDLNDSLVRGLALDEADASRLETVMALYKGEYMKDCDYPWAVQRQAELQRKYTEFLRRSAHLHKREGDLQASVRCLERLLADCPESEQDGRELMRLHMKLGNRYEAVRVYQRLSDSVEALLDTPVESETRALFQQILASDVRDPQ